MGDGDFCAGDRLAITAGHETADTGGCALRESGGCGECDHKAKGKLGHAVTADWVISGPRCGRTWVKKNMAQPLRATRDSSVRGSQNPRDWAAEG